MEKDVLQLLREDHAALERLKDRLSAAKPGRARSLVFQNTSRVLGAHQTIIDRTVLPALKAYGRGCVSSELLTGHMALKRLLAESLTLHHDQAAFHEAIRHLVGRLGLQCELERAELLPALYRYLDDEQRCTLAVEAELHLTRLLGESRQFADDSALMPPAGDLLEEAYVVLGSLPRSSPQTEH